MKQTILLVIMLLALALVACGGEEEAGKETVNVAARDIAFGTERIEATAGEPVQVILSNEGMLEHDFSIAEIPLSGEAHADEEGMDGHEMAMDEEELDVHVAAGPGQSANVTFTPAEPGEYAYFCTVPGHKDAGMVGSLVVTAP